MRVRTRAEAVVRLPTNLHEIRGKRTVKEIAEASGLNPATIRQIEQGRLVPLEKHIRPLEQAYGELVAGWYPPAVLLVLIPEATEEQAA